MIKLIKWLKEIFTKYTANELWDLACRADEVRLDEIKEQVAKDKAKHMRLYVWEDFDTRSFAGLAIALAHTEEEAKKLIEKQYAWDIERWGDVREFELDKPVAFVIGGDD